MKKKLIKLMSLLLVVAMSLSTFACQLIQVDMDKAYDQTVATVKVFDEDGAPVDTITNKDVMSAFSANGSYYIYSMGYTVEQTLDAILDNLVNNKIMTQVALDYFYNKGVVEHSDKGKWDAERYLSDEEVATANYTVKKGVNDAIDTYIVEDETEDDKESFKPTVRTVPTGATNYTHELTVEEKNNYSIDRGIADGNGTVNNKERRNAYYKLLKSMSESGYIESSFDWNTGSIIDTDYYEDSVKEQLENTLVTKYQAYLVYDYYNTISLSQLATIYEDNYNAQQEAKSYTDFTNALSSASASSPVLFNQFSGKFAYVYNLLLGVDDVQSAKIAELDKSNSEKYMADREEILKTTTTVKDLRSSWIEAGYDFDFTTKTFINDYALSSNPFAFKGTFNWVNQDGYTRELKSDADGKYYEFKKDGKVDEDYIPEYKAVAEELTLDGFIEEMETYLYGSAQTKVTLAPEDETIMGKTPIYKAVKSTATLDDDKINELLFAFSTDPGSLNTYKGYVVADGYDLGYTEKYMAEFEKAGRLLIKWASEGNNIGSYVIVATDYGYHVMFMNELVLDTANKATLYEYLGKSEQDLTTEYATMLANIRDGEVEEYEDNYLYHLQQAVASSSANSYANNIVLGKQNSIRDNGDKVSINRDYLKNLL